MYIFFDNNVYFFENNIEDNILFLKLQKKNPDKSSDEIKSIVKLYNSMTNYKCRYSTKLENMVMNCINNL